MQGEQYSSLGQRSRLITSFDNSHDKNERKYMTLSSNDEHSMEA